MASDRSLEHSIESAVKHYSSLFALPTYPRIVSFTLLSCVLGGVLTIFLFDLSLQRLILAFEFGFSLFLFSTISDLISRQLFMKSDMVYNNKRCAALSLFSVLLWFGFLFVGRLLSYVLHSWSFWVYLFLVGFAAVCILRMIVLSSTSFTASWRIIASSLMQPSLCLLPMFYVSYQVGYIFGIGSVAYFFFSILISILTAFVFIGFVDSIGDETLGCPTTWALKVFLANWMENLNAPLESLFEGFSKEKTIDFSLLAFEAESRVNSVIVVSSFHPGPFRNVGSSLLPSMIQKELEKKLGCVVAVPHGLFGHEFDLSSQRQNQKVIGGILESADFANFRSKATPYVRSKKGVAVAGCQIFGDCAVITLTLAPETTEDFPQDVGDFINEEASKLGMTHVMIINAHNSVNNPFDVSTAVESLKEAALDVLKKASKLKSSSFKVGTAKVVPHTFHLEDGMGPGGICVLAIRVGEQTCAYVTIDGNNMISGLREHILESLNGLDVNSGEILTTDTHVVNGIVTTARGYHPVGEVMPHGELIEYVESAVRKAVEGLTSGRTAWRVGQVPHVKVIGEKQIQEMTLLADKALRRAKQRQSRCSPLQVHF